MEQNATFWTNADKPKLGKLLEYHKTLARHSVGACNPSTPEAVPGQAGTHRETLSQESKQAFSSSSMKKHGPTGWVRRLGLRVQERSKAPCCTAEALYSGGVLLCFEMASFWAHKNPSPCWAQPSVLNCMLWHSTLYMMLLNTSSIFLVQPEPAI